MGMIQKSPNNTSQVIKQFKIMDNLFDSVDILMHFQN
jgi:hypothetical protein